MTQPLFQTVGWTFRTCTLLEPKADWQSYVFLIDICQTYPYCCCFCLAGWEPTCDPVRRCAHDGIWCCGKVWRPFHHYTRPDCRWSVSCHIWYDRCCWTLQSAVRGHELVTKPVHRGFVAIIGIGASILFWKTSQCHSDRSVETYSKPLYHYQCKLKIPPPSQSLFYWSVPYTELYLLV